MEIEFTHSSAERAETEKDPGTQNTAGCAETGAQQKHPLWRQQAEQSLLKLKAGSPLHDFLSGPVLHKLSIDAQQEAPPCQLLEGQGLKVAGVPLHRGGLDGGRPAQGLEAVG